jgi:hypothetical protein
MPCPMVWNSATHNEYPGVRVFAQHVKSAVMLAHNSVLAAHVKQTCAANQKRQLGPFKEGELVYLSSKNLSFPKGLAQKFIPKYIGPYLIVRDFRNNSFKIDIPNSMKQRGVHNVFHSLLLWVHILNND